MISLVYQNFKIHKNVNSVQIRVFFIANKPEKVKKKSYFYRQKPFRVERGQFELSEVSLRSFPA